MLEKRAYIFHGYGANSAANWFPWLKKQLIDRGIEVIVPDFPDILLPHKDDWVHSLEDYTFDENTLIVGHSLGGVTALRFLEQFAGKVSRVFLVATPFDDLHWPQLVNSHFFDEPFDWDALVKKSGSYLVVSDANDPFIALSHGDLFSQHLHCKHSVIDGGDHFLRFEFPALLKLIESTVEPLE